MLQLRDMSAMIEEIIRGELGTGRVEAVRVTEELGYDEEKVLRVFVVYRDRASRFEPSEMLRTLTAVRRHLRDQDIADPALLSYIPKSEAQWLEAGAK